MEINTKGGGFVSSILVACWAVFGLGSMLPYFESEKLVFFGESLSESKEKKFDALLSLCEELMRISDPLIELSDPSEKEDSATFLIRLEVTRTSSRPLPYEGILATGEVNDGFRVEVNRGGDIALLVENKSVDENGFDALAGNQKLVYMEPAVLNIEVKVEDGMGRISFSGSQKMLPKLSLNACSDPRLGTGFSSERVFSGVIDAAIFKEVPNRVSVLNEIRFACRLFFSLTVWLSMTRFLKTRSRRW